jgi:hypothetical protein
MDFSANEKGRNGTGRQRGLIEKLKSSSRMPPVTIKLLVQNSRTNGIELS